MSADEIAATVTKHYGKGQTGEEAGHKTESNQQGFSPNAKRAFKTNFDDSSSDDDEPQKEKNKKGNIKYFLVTQVIGVS